MKNGCLVILCQHNSWDDIHATMRQAAMFRHTYKVIGSPIFWNMLNCTFPEWQDKHFELTEVQEQNLQTAGKSSVIICCTSIMPMVSISATVSYGIFVVQVQPMCSPSPPALIFKVRNEFDAELISPSSYIKAIQNLCFSCLRHLHLCICIFWCFHLLVESYPFRLSTCKR